MSTTPSPERTAFEAAVAASPTDQTTRLVFADWLDEHGNPDGAAWQRLDPWERLDRVLATMVLDDEVEDQNGTVTLPDGRPLRVGGGAILDADEAARDNASHGRQTALPGIYWPGERSQGDFEPYDGYDCFGVGAEDALVAAVGIDTDRDTDAGDRGWRRMIALIRTASGVVFARHQPEGGQ